MAGTMDQDTYLKNILEQLHQRGFRITEQRRLLLRIILESGWASSKEIYYEAKKQDPGIGAATVYRTIHLLEDLGVIRKELRIRMEVLPETWTKNRKDEPVMPLTFLDRGKSAVIRKVGGNAEIHRFLEGLGFHVGQEISVVSANRGNLIVQVKDARVAVSREIANKIMV